MWFLKNLSKSAEVDSGQLRKRKNVMIKWQQKGELMFISTS